MSADGGHTLLPCPLRCFRVEKSQKVNAPKNQTRLRKALSHVDRTSNRGLHQCPRTYKREISPQRVWAKPLFHEKRAPPTLISTGRNEASAAGSSKGLAEKGHFSASRIREQMASHRPQKAGHDVETRVQPKENREGTWSQNRSQGWRNASSRGDRGHLHMREIGRPERTQAAKARWRKRSPEQVRPDRSPAEAPRTDKPNKG